MDKSIRVRILGRDYPLRVRDGDETLTRDIAAYVNDKMVAFREAHPEESDLTTAVITALAIAEELYATWEDEDQAQAALAEQLDALSDTLDAALSDAPSPETTAP
ncbi:MAG: cell division protein ZapA [Bacteroidetes bacterium]|jgi:cell division protein ZapA|nr:cell division protein ZapA [Bacteroidota bacterium]